MKICILTIVKNEHLYLDEWIKYHLDIGVDNIFIFEDVDSNSHKEITDKYKDKVFLKKVSDIISSKDIIVAQNLKKTKYSSIQLLYAERALQYLQSNYLYKWCFVIDVDEFITLENKDNNINNILDMYNNYDALILSWQCYGANKLVYRPDYSTKGVIDTFTTTIDSRMSKYYASVPMNDKKTCYCLPKFNKEYFGSIHVPKDNCNYCNTCFIKDNKVNSYKNIYIRHYITKSWEEYVWKKNCRGYFMGFARSYDVFFRLNPDMIGMKEELLSKLDDEVLVVIPYSYKDVQHDSLKITLTSWKQYCKSRYHFVVVGDFDSSLEQEFPWVEFIYVEKSFVKKNQCNSHIDIQYKMEIVYDLFKDRYEGFIWLTDNNYAIKPFYTYEIKTIHFYNYAFIGDKYSPIECWKYDLWKTRQLLDRENLPHIDYTTHYPCYLEFSILKEIWNKYNMREESYIIENVYFNYFIHIKPVKVDKKRLKIVNQEVSENEFQKALKDPNINFVYISQDGWSKELEKSLKDVINN